MKTRNILALLLIVCILCALTACGSSTLTGKYTIADVTDDPDGATFADLDSMYKAVDENIEEYIYMEFFEDSQYVLVMFGEVEASGRYTRDGNTLTLSSSGGGTTATIAGNEVTWTYENGAKLIFKSSQDVAGMNMWLIIGLIALAVVVIGTVVCVFVIRKKKKQVTEA